MTKKKSRPSRATAKAKTSRAPKLGVVTGSKWVPQELLPAPELGEESISNLRRCNIVCQDGRESGGIIFDVESPDGDSHTEICLTNGQLKELLDFCQWKTRPRVYSNDQDERRTS